MLILVAGTDAIAASRQTSKDGSFSFAGVLPGAYTVSAAHPGWTFSNVQPHFLPVLSHIASQHVYRLQNDIRVTVGHAAATLGSPIVAEGFAVRGRMADGVSGVTFLLYAGKSGGSARRVQCDKTLAAGAPGVFFLRFALSFFVLLPSLLLSIPCC
jgi:hypothetical protein